MLKSHPAADFITLIPERHFYYHEDFFVTVIILKLVYNNIYFGLMNDPGMF